MRLPDFLIIGTARAGTTAATINLSRHPDVDVCPRNAPGAGAEEMHFFCDDDIWERGVDWYASHFASEKCVVGGKSTDYLAKIVSHERMFGLLPDAQLIVFLREPIARAYSHWKFFNGLYGDRYLHLWSRAPFADVVGLTAEVEPPWFHREILDFGHYAEQLEHLWEFYTREQTLIVIAERCLADMPAEYSRIFAFLGVAAPVVDCALYRTDNASPSNVGPIHEEDRLRLLEHYRPHNERLFELLGERIVEWEV